VSARPAIVVVGGTTASGKTDLALALARRLGGELVGADSVQVYRGFDIGSAKPTADELDGITHHLIDVVDPDEAIDAARYAALADEAIAGIAERGRLPIVVGGTGLWLRALVRGLVALPAPDPAVREGLEAEVRRVGAPAVHARLATIDPRAAAAIHPNDALRIVRALEVHAQTGEPLGELRHRHALGAPRHPTLFFALDRPRDALRARLEARVASMIARGWVDEVRALLARWGPDVRAFGSVGYRELLDHVRGVRSLVQAAEAAVRASWVYTRRQRTWFRGEPGIDVRLDEGARDVEAIVRRVEAFLDAQERGA
jgi:tRNA dimethylallyltransferase